MGDVAPRAYSEAVEQEAQFSDSIAVTQRGVETSNVSIAARTSASVTSVQVRAMDLVQIHAVGWRINLTAGS